MSLVTCLFSFSYVDYKAYPGVDKMYRTGVYDWGWPDAVGGMRRCPSADNNLT